MGIIIGSTAIKHWFPDFPREPNDVDIIKTDIIDEKVSEKRIELHENPIFADYKNAVMDANSLYTLKISHLFWDINWEKHMFDVQFLKKKGCLVDLKLFYRLYGYWNTYHIKNKRSDLKMTSERFFDNAVKCEYDHDYLHTLLNETPTFNKVLKDGEEVDVDQNKFNSLSFTEKCDLVTEEVMVMAFERWSYLDYRNAYAKMLKKFIISHAPLWEAIFIIENYIELHKPKFNYFKTIQNGLQTIKHNP